MGNPRRDKILLFPKKESYIIRNISRNEVPLSIQKPPLTNPCK